MCPHLSANYVLGCPSNMAQVSVWAGNLQIRCQYCDFLKIYKGLKAITGNFYLPNQPYLPQNTTTIIKHFQIAYTEIQLCVFDPSLIKIEEIVKLV